MAKKFRARLRRTNIFIFQNYSSIGQFFYVKNNALNCCLSMGNKSSGKKVLNTNFYPDQKGINKFIKGKSELKGINKLKRKILN